MRVSPSGGGKGIETVKDIKPSVSSGAEVTSQKHKPRNPDIPHAPQEDLEKVLTSFEKRFEKFKKIFRTQAEFSVDKDTNMVIVKIKDTETGEVVRQIPPEVIVKLAKTIDEFLGLLFDERG